MKVQVPRAPLRPGAMADTSGRSQHLPKPFVVSSRQACLCVLPESLTTGEGGPTGQQATGEGKAQEASGRGNTTTPPEEEASPPVPRKGPVGPRVTSQSSRELCCGPC